MRVSVSVKLGVVAPDGLNLGKLASGVENLDEFWTEDHDVDAGVVFLKDLGRDAQYVRDALAEAVNVTIESCNDVVKLCVGRPYHTHVLNTFLQRRHLLHKDLGIEAVSRFIKGEDCSLDVEDPLPPALIELFKELTVSDTYRARHKKRDIVTYHFLLGIPKALVEAVTDLDYSSTRLPVS